MFWNVLVVALVVACGFLDLSSLRTELDRTVHRDTVAGCIRAHTVPYASVDADAHVPGSTLLFKRSLYDALVDCVDLAFNQSTDIDKTVTALVACVALPLGIPQDLHYRTALRAAVHYCVHTTGLEYNVRLEGWGWYCWYLASGIFTAILVIKCWPTRVLNRWKPAAWIVCSIAARGTAAILAHIPIGDLLALCLHFVRTGWLYGIVGGVALLVFCTGAAFYHSLPRRLHQEVDIDLRHPDRAPVRSSEIRPKWWAVFEEADPNPRVDRGPVHRRVRPEALFGVQPQFADPPRAAAVVAQRLDSGDYRHLGICFRVGDKGMSVLHNLLAGGHDLNAPDFTSLVVLHNGVASPIGEFHTFGPMRQGRTKGEVITFKWPTALDQVKSARPVISPTPAAQLALWTMDRNGRGDRFKYAGAGKVSYDKGEYVYHWDTHPGDSGSPLFDESGAVRAIHYGGSGRGNVGIAFAPENFPNLKDYLHTPWGQVADFAEPRGELVHHESSPPVVVSIDCCDGQKDRHARECGCLGETKCTYMKRCPFHNGEVAKGESSGQPPRKEKKKVTVTTPKEESAVAKPKGKASSEVHILEVIQEQLIELASVQRTQMASIRQIQEEAAQQRVYTPGVRNEPKTYRKGPSRDPIEESVHSGDDRKPRSKAEACAYCAKKGHTAQECRKLKQDRAVKPESKPKPAVKVKPEAKDLASDRSSSDSDPGNGPVLRLKKAGGDRSSSRKGKQAQPETSSRQ